MKTIEDVGIRVVKPGECLSRGWQVFGENWPLYIGIALVLVVISLLFVINWFIFGPLVVGLSYLILYQLRGGRPEFGMISKGFSKFVPAMVIGLIFMFPTALDTIFRLGVMAIDISQGMNPNAEPGMIFLVTRVAGIFMSLFVLACAVVFAIFLSMAFPILADNDLPLLDTLRLSFEAGKKNAGGLFLLLLLKGAMILAGLMLCCVGVVVAIPLIYIMDAIAYTQIFGLDDVRESAPPTPGAYDFGAVR
ncbi:MAG: hypothetical protein R2684_01560 [Pyrinomonadaceae bacterium]